MLEVFVEKFGEGNGAAAAAAGAPGEMCGTSAASAANVMETCQLRGIALGAIAVSAPLAAPAAVVARAPELTARAVPEVVAQRCRPCPALHQWLRCYLHCSDDLESPLRGTREVVCEVFSRTVSSRAILCCRLLVFVPDLCTY